MIQYICEGLLLGECPKPESCRHWKPHSKRSYFCEGRCIFNDNKKYDCISVMPDFLDENEFEM